MITTNIYCLKDPRDDSIKYIGKANNVDERMKLHFHKRGNTRKECWVESLRRKGLRPTSEIIDEVPISEWDFWERHYISLYRSWGFDLKNGTFGGDGFHITKEARDKTTKKITGRKHSEETKRKIGLAHKGRKHSKEWVDKISKALTGKKLSDEHRKSLRDNHGGKIAVIQYDLDGNFIKEHESISDALKYNNCTRMMSMCIHRAAKGERKTSLGYKWKIK